MQFSLKTGLIVSAGLAILFAQYPYIYQLGFHGQGYGIYAPSGRFATVAVVEVVLVMGWALARQGRFPWKVMLGSAALLLLSGSTLLIAFLGIKEQRIFLAVPTILALMLSAAVIAVYAAYRAISWVRSVAGTLSHGGGDARGNRT